MMKGVRITIAVLCLSGLADAWALSGRSRPSGETPVLLEQLYEREANPKKRADIAMDLMDMRLKLLGSAFKDGQGQQQQVVQDYLKAVGLLEKAVSGASHTGTSKKAEVHLRRHIREMEMLQISVSFYEREALDEVLSRITNLREEILYSIMNPRRESAKR